MSPETLQPRDIAEVEAALIDCHELWRRSPGGGRWPFAGDAPWHLMQREVLAGDYSGDGQDAVSSSTRPRPPLDAEEVDARDRMTAWLQLVEDETDRRLLWLATAALWRGEGRVPWSAIKGWMKWERSPDALVHRYRKALAVIACRVNGWPVRRARAMAA